MTGYYLLTLVVTLTIALMCGILHFTLKALKKENSAINEKQFMKAQGKVIDKFFDGQEVIVGGEPTLLINICINQIEHQVKHVVEQTMYLKYDIGDEIELFVNQSNGLKIYSITESSGSL